MLERVTCSWYDGLHGYLTAQGFAPERAARLLDPLFDLYYHEAQLEDRDTIWPRPGRTPPPAVCWSCAWNATGMWWSPG